MDASPNGSAGSSVRRLSGARSERESEDPLRGIIFDFDGTIAETERFGERVAYNRAFEEFGLDWFWNEELYADLLSVAGGKERLRYYMARHRPNLVGDSASERLIGELHAAKKRKFGELAGSIPFRPGVQRLIYEAHLAGLRVAIATTASRSGVQALLAQDSAVAGMIDVIAAGEDVERKKPAPDVYVRALAELNLGAGACVAIEDSRIGLSASLAAGLTTVVTRSDYTVDDDFTGAAAVLSTLGDYDVAALALSGPSPASGMVDLTFLRNLLRGGAPRAESDAADVDADGGRNAR